PATIVIYTLSLHDALPIYGPETIFQTGISNYTNIALDGGNEDGTFRFGYTNDDRQGILPNSLIKRDIVDLSGTYNLNDKLTASGDRKSTRLNSSHVKISYA